jgi:hypothetical protein
MRIEDPFEQNEADEIINTWPPKSQEVAQSMIQKYGPPDEMTPSCLIWRNNWPWKRTVVYRDEVRHLFPTPHTDLLEQTIDYQVPPEKFGDLASYNGSVMAGRTAGKLAARCDKEEMNFLALNLAHDLIIAKCTVYEARRMHTEIAVAFMMEDPHAYTQGLQFEMAKSNTSDPDQPDVFEAMKGVAKTMKEKTTELQETG